MVYSSSEIKKFEYLIDSELKDEKGEIRGKWFRNVPFEIVPKGLIQQIYGHPFDYDDYLKWAGWYDLLLVIWDLGLFDKDNQLIAFQYGYWDPLAKTMELVRLTIHPKLFRISGETIRDCKDACKWYAQQLDVERIYWITCKWKSVMRKLPGEVILNEARVMEVL